MSPDGSAAAAEALAEALALERELYPLRRARTQRDAETLAGAVACIVANVAVRYLTAPSFDDNAVAISLDGSNGTLARYRGKHEVRMMPAIVSLLADPRVSQSGPWIHLTKGSWSSGLRSTIKAGSRMKEAIMVHALRAEDFGREPGEEIVILKTANDPAEAAAQALDRTGHAASAGSRAPYDDTEETHRLRGELRLINSALASADIDYDGPDRFDLTERHLRRYFNNGTFEHGGRMFGGFWLRMSKANRRRLSIDGRSVVLLDYAGMAVSLAYAMVNAAWLPERDAYAVPMPHLKDSSAAPGLLPRGSVKTMMLSMLFARKPLSRWPAGLSREHFNGLSLPAVIAQIRAAHPALESLWFTGRGYELFRAESDIMIDVLTQLLAHSVVALPVHDGLAVPYDAEDLAKQTMLDAFARRTGGARTRVERE